MMIPPEVSVLSRILVDLGMASDHDCVQKAYAIINDLKRQGYAVTQPDDHFGR